jgi:hypothetical protein
MLMSGVALKRLLREWAALIAVLAMVLGPLAMIVVRSHGASGKVAIAAGLKPLALCLPGGMAGGTGGEPMADCDHCMPAQIIALAQPFTASSAPLPARTTLARPQDIRIAAFPRAPPARGPPAA